MIAGDGGSPSLRATADVEITVWRNYFAPVFQNENQYSQTIAFDTPASVISNAVTATDADSADWVINKFVQQIWACLWAKNITFFVTLFYFF